jgi:hypothetical protein
MTILNDEFEIIWKEAAVAYYNVVLQFLHGKTGRDFEKC